MVKELPLTASNNKPELTPREADVITEVIVLRQAIRFLEERGFVVTRGRIRPKDGRSIESKEAA